jgi:hypothetical protein
MVLGSKGVVMKEMVEIMMRFRGGDVFTDNQVRGIARAVVKGQRLRFTGLGIWACHRATLTSKLHALKW